MMWLQSLAGAAIVPLAVFERLVFAAERQNASAEKQRVELLELVLLVCSAVAVAAGNVMTEWCYQDYELDG